MGVNTKFYKLLILYLHPPTKYKIYNITFGAVSMERSSDLTRNTGVWIFINKQG